jgi:hypothetical protein
MNSNVSFSVTYKYDQFLNVIFIRQTVTPYELVLLCLYRIFCASPNCMILPQGLDGKYFGECTRIIFIARRI